MDASVVVVRIVSPFLHITAHYVLVCEWKQKTTYVRADIVGKQRNAVFNSVISHEFRKSKFQGNKQRNEQVPPTAQPEIST